MGALYYSWVDPHYEIHHAIKVAENGRVLHLNMTNLHINESNNDIVEVGAEEITEEQFLAYKQSIQTQLDQI